MADGEEKGSADFYAVLGLNKDCSDTDLKNAYKKLALRWHPDRCLASRNSKGEEEAKEKFQEIQAAYSVLSDSNKRFLYDFGVYDSDDDDENSQGMGDFMGEMVQMMSQTKPSETRHESLEELQQLFVDMFQADLRMGFHADPSPSRYRESSSSSSSPPSSSSTSFLPQSTNGGTAKRASNCMSSGPGKAKLDKLDAGATGFCFGLSDSYDEPRGTGSSNSRRRSGRKQKVSSKHDVSS